MPFAAYRDARGRFARRPGWWRPRDARGRFRSVRRRWSDASATTPIEYGTATFYVGGQQVGTGTVNHTTTSYHLSNFTPTTWTIQGTGDTWTTSSATVWNAPSLPTFRAAGTITNELMVACNDPDFIVGEVADMLKERLRTELAKEGLTLNEDEGIWQQWVGDPRRMDGFAANLVEVEVSWTPSPRTNEAWAHWTSPEAQARAADRVEEPTARALREDRERERRRAAERAAEEARRRNERRLAEEEAARQRALELMADVLSDEQMSEYAEHKHFHIETADGRRRYRIRHGRAGNIYLVRDGEREAGGQGHLGRYCFHEYHPDERPPIEDNLIAQALFIQDDEEAFLRIANPC